MSLILIEKSDLNQLSESKSIWRPVSPKLSQVEEIAKSFFPFHHFKFRLGVYFSYSLPNTCTLRPTILTAYSAEEDEYLQRANFCRNICLDLNKNHN